MMHMRSACVSALFATLIMLHSRTALHAENASEVPPSNEATSELALPPFRFTQPGPFYPSTLRRRDLEGSVFFKFRISLDGHVADLRVHKERSEENFVNAALGVIRSVEFTVPANWSESGAVNHDFRVRVAFALTPCPSSTDDLDGTKVILICGTRIPR
jgi:TonB family protein